MDPGQYVGDGSINTEGACIHTGNTFDAGTSVCTSGADGTTVAGVTDIVICEETGSTWNPEEIFYSSTTPPLECTDGSTVDSKCIEAAPFVDPINGVSVAADASACGAVDLTAGTASALCLAVTTAAGGAAGACLYTPEVSKNDEIYVKTRNSVLKTRNCV